MGFLIWANPINHHLLFHAVALYATLRLEVNIRLKAWLTTEKQETNNIYSPSYWSHTRHFPLHWVPIQRGVCAISLSSRCTKAKKSWMPQVLNIPDQSNLPIYDKIRDEPPILSRSGFSELSPSYQNNRYTISQQVLSYLLPSTYNKRGKGYSGTTEGYNGRKEKSHPSGQGTLAKPYQNRGDSYRSFPLEIKN